jgi:hypothetical protein
MSVFVAICCRAALIGTRTALARRKQAVGTTCRHTA